MEAAPLKTVIPVVDDQLEIARSLVSSLESGDQLDADKRLSELTRSYQSEMFQEIGKLTRDLHDALGHCQNEKRLVDITNNEMPDARDRLSYVISKTEESAHKTMDLIENLMPISSELEQESKNMQDDWARFKRREMDVEEFRKLSAKLESFLGTACSNAERIRNDLTSVMLGQDYQDLTGQIIRKVIQTVQDVEGKLVDVIRHAKDEPATTEEEEHEMQIRAEGPQINTEGKANVMVDQDDVDDLLSSLGF